VRKPIRNASTGRRQGPSSDAPAGKPGQVRIIAGSLRGSRIVVPAVPGLRPTPDRLRETLFNWLAPVIEGARVLDLFAGSGALGLEAASRGAASVLMIERDRAAAENLRATAQRLKVDDRVDVRQTDALTSGNTLSGPFDLVFVDPPFSAGLWLASFELLLTAGLLAEGARVYVERPVDAGWDWPAAWTVHRQARAGDSEGTLLLLRAVRPAAELPAASRP
jgi:16S rRNA (guanine966-N2)-methyltransferase